MTIRGSEWWSRLDSDSESRRIHYVCLSGFLLSTRSHPWGAAASGSCLQIFFSLKSFLVG